MKTTLCALLFLFSLATQAREPIPVFIFHPDEKYGPVSPEFFLAKVQLAMPNLPRTLDFNSLASLSPETALTTGGLLQSDNDPKAAALFRQEGNSPLLFELPPYHKWRIVEYWLHLPANVTRFWGLGNHEGDWEGIAILFDGEEDVAAIYAAQHDGGTWYCKDEVEWSEFYGGKPRPVFYSALGTHANYTTVGRHARNRYGIGDDITAYGVAFDGAEQIRDLKDQFFAGFPGRWGAKSWIPWNQGPYLPRPGFKTLPQTMSQMTAQKMAIGLNRCIEKMPKKISP